MIYNSDIRGKTNSLEAVTARRAEHFYLEERDLRNDQASLRILTYNEPRIIRSRLPNGGPGSGVWRSSAQQLRELLSMRHVSKEVEWT